MERLCIDEKDSERFEENEKMFHPTSLLAIWMNEPTTAKVRYRKLRAAIVHMNRAKEAYNREYYKGCLMDD